MYLTEQSRRYRTDSSKSQNWRYEGGLDQCIDEHGVRFRRYAEYDCTDKATDMTRHFIGYEAIPVTDEDQNQRCLTTGRKLCCISINPHWEAQKTAIRKHLSDEDLALSMPHGISKSNRSLATSSET